jgi:CrcB protein
MFSLEAIQLLEAARFGLAGLYLCASLISWLVAVWSGFALATRINGLRRT